MRWMHWVRQLPGGIRINVPFRFDGRGKRKLTAWLMGRDGCLKAVYAAGPVLNPAPAEGQVEQSRFRETTFAGGLRPCGAARLNGVLHYFTRGPDGIL